MTKESPASWEYRVESLGGGLSSMKPEALEALLNEHAERGWALDTLIPLTNSNRVVIVLKRETRRRGRPRRRGFPGLDFSGV